MSGLDILAKKMIKQIFKRDNIGDRIFETLVKPMTIILTKTDIFSCKYTI